MQPASIIILNKFLDAVLRLKCPQGDKDILFAIVRLTKGTKEYPGGVFSFSIAEYLRRDESQIARRLNDLIKRNIIQENRGPSYLPIRLFDVNFNYNEWKAEKRTPVKTKKNSAEPAAEPTFWDDMEASTPPRDLLKLPAKGAKEHAAADRGSGGGWDHLP